MVWSITSKAVKSEAAGFMMNSPDDENNEDEDDDDDEDENTKVEVQMLIGVLLEDQSAAQVKPSRKKQNKTVNFILTLLITYTEVE